MRPVLGILATPGRRPPTFTSIKIAAVIVTPWPRTNGGQCREMAGWDPRVLPLKLLNGPHLRPPTFGKSRGSRIWRVPTENNTTFSPKKAPPRGMPSSGLKALPGCRATSADNAGMMGLGGQCREANHRASLLSFASRRLVAQVTSQPAPHWLNRRGYLFKLAAGLA